MVFSHSGRRLLMPKPVLEVLVPWSAVVSGWRRVAHEAATLKTATREDSMEVAKARTGESHFLRMTAWFLRNQSSGDVALRREDTLALPGIPVLAYDVHPWLGVPRSDFQSGMPSMLCASEVMVDDVAADPNGIEVAVHELMVRDD